MDGRRLAWRSLGEGPPLMLVNGYSATAADWDPTLLRVLAGSFRLICPDNRGMGGSELGDPEALSIDAMAGDLVGLLDALGLRDAHLAGWSMGGFVAQAVAGRAPARVRRMALLASDPGGPMTILPDPEVWARLTDYSGSPREQAARLISVLFPAEVAAGVDRLFGEVVAAARAELSTVAMSAQKRAIEDWRAERPRPLGSDVPPVLVVCGSEDAVVPPANAGVLAERWPGARVEAFAGGGHAFMAQEPERVGELLAGFFAG